MYLLFFFFFYFVIDSCDLRRLSIQESPECNYIIIKYRTVRRYTSAKGWTFSRTDYTHAVIFRRQNREEGVIEKGKLDIER